LPQAERQPTNPQTHFSDYVHVVLAGQENLKGVTTINKKGDLFEKCELSRHIYSTLEGFNICIVSTLSELNHGKDTPLSLVKGALESIFACIFAREDAQYVLKLARAEIPSSSSTAPVTDLLAP